jgi:hypothetical protein
VVAERDHVCAAREQLVRDLRRDPRAVRRVLAVEDAEVDVELVPQPRQPLLDDPAPRNAEDVGDEEDPQRL